MNYKKPYLTLFNALTDILEALEQCNYGQARQLLILAQQQAEENILSAESFDD